MTQSAEYFEYLQGRSRFGLVYRRYWLYPRLCRHLNGRVLDVGCGIGDMVRFRPGTVGVDVNPVSVEWCKEQGLEAYLMDQDVLLFSAQEFDGVVLDNVLEHLADPKPLLAEIRRVLKPGGAFVVGVPGVRGYSCDPDHKNFYAEVDLKRCLQQAGFECSSCFYMPFKSAWLNRIAPQYCLYGVFYPVNPKHD